MGKGNTVDSETTKYGCYYILFFLLCVCSCYRVRSCQILFAHSYTHIQLVVFAYTFFTFKKYTLYFSSFVATPPRTLSFRLNNLLALTSHNESRSRNRRSTRGRKKRKSSCLPSPLLPLLLLLLPLPPTISAPTIKRAKCFFLLRCHHSQAPGAAHIPCTSERSKFIVTFLFLIHCCCF